MDEAYKYLKDPLGIRVFEAVKDSAREYTNDSAESKFLMLPDKITNLVSILAQTFTMLTFSPNLPLDNVKNSKVFCLYYAIIIAGIQVYLKDQSIIKNAYSYVWEEKDKEIEKTSQALWKFLTGKVEIEKYLCEAMDETVYAMKHSTKGLWDLRDKKYKLLKRELNKWCDVSIVSGYFFAKSLAKYS